MRILAISIYSILILLVCSCDNEPHSLQKENSYKMVLTAEGNIDNYNFNFFISSNPLISVLYTNEFERIESPYSLTANDIKSINKTFHLKFHDSSTPYLIFSGTAYHFLNENDLRDSLLIRVQGYYNDRKIMDTSHLFRSFYDTEIKEMYDSIQNWNSCDIILTKPEN